MDNILQVNNLKVSFQTFKGEANVIDIDRFTINEGEIYGLSGESGSGKSVFALSILNLITVPGRIKSGEILYKGQDILKMSNAKLSRIRGEEIAMIFQDPMASLNPVLTVGRQMVLTISAHKRLSKKEAEREAKKGFEEVKLPDPDTVFNKYPHELSGGMRQRVLIALALSCGAKFLIADEATRSLDVTIQAGILDMLKELRDNKGVTILLISNNLGIVSEMCDRAGILYSGNIVEDGNVDEVFLNPSHPYTRALIEAVPSTDRNKKLLDLPGYIPDPLSIPIGCKFNPRCPSAMDICRSSEPPQYDLSSTHHVTCYLYANKEAKSCF